MSGTRVERCESTAQHHPTADSEQAAIDAFEEELNEVRYQGPVTWKFAFEGATTAAEVRQRFSAGGELVGELLRQGFSRQAITAAFRDAANESDVRRNIGATGDRLRQGATLITAKAPKPSMPAP